MHAYLRETITRGVRRTTLLRTTTTNNLCTSLAALLRDFFMYLKCNKITDNCLRIYYKTKFLTHDRPIKSK